MGRRSIIEKNRVYVEYTDENRRIKAWVIMRDENNIKVELPSGFVMNLEKRNNRGTYKFQLGMLEFISDGKPVV